MYFIGDVHGKTGEYLSLLRKLPDGAESIQVGDMGLGFKGVGLPPPGTSMPKGWHMFIRGNHDNPKKCQEHQSYLGEYGYINNDRTFYLGGAWSIDQAWRTENISWWRDEELSIEELNKAQQLYLDSKPRIVVTHEAPTKAAITMLTGLMVGSYEKNVTCVEQDEKYAYYKAKTGCVNTRTSQALQQMFDLHKPEVWVFGHYHVDKDFEIEGTKFICLAELSVREIR